MADHSKPTVTSLYSNFVAELDARLDDLAVMLDPARTTTSNIPTGAIRWASASSKWQLWNGSAWVDLAATYAINALTASSAAKWTTARTLSLSGDVTGSASVDGSANATISATLSNTGVAAGTYRSVTVDAKGRVTGATNPTTLAGYGITDAVPAADVAQVPAASKIVKATASGPIDLGWLDTAVARELRMLAVGINPSLDLDFGRQNYRRQNGAKGLETLADPFASFITFTRTTTASYFSADGLLKTAAINEPRIEYNPITGECKGLLIEESRGNLLTYSEQFENAAWGKLRLSVVDNVAVAPDGTLTGDKLIEDTQTGWHTISSNRSFTSGVLYTLSGYYKAAERTMVLIRLGNIGASFPGGIDHQAIFDLSTGTIVSTGTALTHVSITPVGNGWYRCGIAASAQATSTDSVHPALIARSDGVSSYQGDGTSGIYIWGAQLEAGPFPTSYIKTEASAVTRGADNASVTGANFSSWYRQGECGLLCEFSVPYAGGTSNAVRICDNSENNRIALQGFASGAPRNRFLLTKDGTTVYGAEATLNANIKNRHTLGINEGVVFAARNGEFATGGLTPSSMPNNVNRLTIGAARTSAHLNGHISRLTYWPKRLTNTQLQELSK